MTNIIYVVLLIEFMLFVFTEYTAYILNLTLLHWRRDCLPEARKDSKQCEGSRAERRTSRGLEDRGSREDRLRHLGDSRLERGGHTATGGDKTPKKTDHD